MMKITVIASEARQSRKKISKIYNKKTGLPRHFIPRNDETTSFNYILLKAS
jgi:hypothetical protein